MIQHRISGWVACTMVLIVSSASLPAQNPAPAPAKRPTVCSTPAHHALDFWIGEWDVTNAAGKVAGRSNVASILDGCVIFENWSSAGSVYEGKSFNVLDAASGTWTQTWVDNTGSPAQMTGAFSGRDLVYQREFKKPDGTHAQSRMTFFNLGAESVRQLIEESSDGGKTWSTQYDLLYKRRKEK